MSRDKQTEIQQFAIDLQNASQKASKIITDETKNYVKEHHNYNNLIDYAKAHIKSRFEYEAEFLTELGYVKASEVAREIFEEMLRDIAHGLEIARTTRKKFLHNIEKNNIWVYHYDGEIKALEGIECLIAELKKKYTEEEK